MARTLLRFYVLGYRPTVHHHWVNFVKELTTNSQPFDISDTRHTNNVVGGLGSSLARDGVQTGQLEEKPRIRSICSTLKTQLTVPTVRVIPHLVRCSNNRLD